MSFRLTDAAYRYAGALSDSDDIGYSSDGSYGTPAEAATWLVEQPSTASGVLAQPQGRVRPGDAAGDISLRDYVPVAQQAATSTMGSPRASRQAALSSSSFRGTAPQPSQAAWETASDWPEPASQRSLEPSAHPPPHPPPPAPADSLDLDWTSTRRQWQLQSSEFKGFIVQNSQVAWQSGSSQAAQAPMLPHESSVGPPSPGQADSLDIALPSPTKPQRRLHSSAIRGFVPRSSQAAWESICGEGHAHQQLHQRSADRLPLAPTDSLVGSLGWSAREHRHTGADFAWPPFAPRPAEQELAVALERPATRRGPHPLYQAARWELAETYGAANGIAAEQATAADCAEASGKHLGCSTADVLPANTAGGQQTAAIERPNRDGTLSRQQPAEAAQHVQQQDVIAGCAAHLPTALHARKGTAKTFTKRVLRAAKRLLTGKSGKKTAPSTAPAHTEANPAWDRPQVAKSKGTDGDLGYQLSRPWSSGLGPLGCGCLESPELDVWHVREAKSTPSTGSPAAQMSNRVLWRNNPAFTDGELQEMEEIKWNLLAAKAAMNQGRLQPDSGADISPLACPSCQQSEEERREQAAELGELKLENKLLKRLWAAYRTREAQLDNQLQKLEAGYEEMADEMWALEAAYEAQAADNDMLQVKVASLESNNAAAFAEVKMLRAELATSPLKSAHASQRRLNRQRLIRKENFYAEQSYGAGHTFHP